MEHTMKSINQEEVPAKNILARAWAVVRKHWTAYIYLNILYYGLVIFGMVYVSFVNPGLQEELLKSIGQAFVQGPLSGVAGAYGGGKVFSAMLLTFVVNLFLGTAIEITLPSLIVPFSGLAMGVLRAVLWGLVLSPSSPSLAGAMIPHSLVLLLEGQGYILALLGVYIHGRAILRPAEYGAADRLHGYLAGLRATGWIYVLVVLVLAAAAIYEAVEVIYLAPLFVK
jgi:hypothetical protein